MNYVIRPDAKREKSAAETRELIIKGLTWAIHEVESASAPAAPKPDCRPDMIAINREDAATRMRSACVEKVRALKDAHELQGVECAAAFNYDGQWKSHLKARAAAEIVTALEAVTLDQQQESK